MKLPEPVFGHLVSREKRFTAHVTLLDGTAVQAHCPNTGSMRGCLFPGAQVTLSRAENPARKLRYTWEMIHGPGGWISIHTHRANQVAKEALTTKHPHVETLTDVESEVPLASGRCDFRGRDQKGRTVWIEVKSVSLLDDQGHFTFPDSVTNRGRRHLLDLAERVAMGDRAVCWFLLMRNDGKGFRPAAQLDPAYAETFHQVRTQGVEFWVHHVDLDPGHMAVGRKEPLLPSPRHPKGTT